MECELKSYACARKCPCRQARFKVALPFGKYDCNVPSHGYYLKLIFFFFGCWKYRIQVKGKLFVSGPLLGKFLQEDKV